MIPYEDLRRDAVLRDHRLYAPMLRSGFVSKTKQAADVLQVSQKKHIHVPITS